MCLDRQGYSVNGRKQYIQGVKTMGSDLRYIHQTKVCQRLMEILPKSFRVEKLRNAIKSTSTTFIPHGTPLQYSCLENPMDGGAWWAAVHGVAKSRTRLSDFTFTFHFNALEKAMATHSSVLAWRIPGMEEPGGPPSMGSHRVGHD